jgi:hypothetical protein
MITYEKPQQYHRRNIIVRYTIIYDKNPKTSSFFEGVPLGFFEGVPELF